MRMRENLVNILCRSSRLNSGDYNLKSKSDLVQICVYCDLGKVEDINHIMLQCPFNSAETVMMLLELHQLSDGPGSFTLARCDDVLWLILGRYNIVDWLSISQLMDAWKITRMLVVDRIHGKILSLR